MISWALIAYVVTGIISFAFFGGWLLLDRSFSWTFMISIVSYIPTVLALYDKDWKGFFVFGFVFLGLLHLYLYDKYFSYYKAKKRGRR